MQPRWEAEVPRGALAIRPDPPWGALGPARGPAALPLRRACSMSPTTPPPPPRPRPLPARLPALLLALDRGGRTASQNAPPESGAQLAREPPAGCRYRLKTCPCTSSRQDGSFWTSVKGSSLQESVAGELPPFGVTGLHCTEFSSFCSLSQARPRGPGEEERLVLQPESIQKGAGVPPPPLQLTATHCDSLRLTATHCLRGCRGPVSSISSLQI
ncbi:zinc finger protein 92 homolog isoform X1 [Prionailurus bengalensis]|uniref:zinc finger protein 92 homolog isoform X1 n=1 Tax=Prionailurus bengalensis TaxID=37029 RepID=UPI001CA9BED7|nr:zinc finger protein 92 homolog isoform X1 [Prionailurus bengalensis]